MNAPTHLLVSENESCGPPILRTIGWLLVLAGFANGIIAALYELSRIVFWHS